MSNFLDRMEITLVNAVASLFSPAGSHARLSIVLYHRVPHEPDELLFGQEDAHSFEAQIRHLSTHFNILPLHQAIQKLQENTLPSRAACITFDDGYANNAEVALPILQKYNATAAFFIAAGFINGGMMWNDKLIELLRRAPGPVLDLGEIGLDKYDISTLTKRRETLFILIDIFKYLPHEERFEQLNRLRQLVPAAVPENLMMTADQIRQLHEAGMEIGGHTVNHPILTRLDKTAAYTEIEQGKKILENIIQAPVRYFAYPNGKPGRDYLSEHVDMLKEIGFNAAVSTAWGTAAKNADIYQLPRFTPWNISRNRFVLQMMQNMYRPVQTVS
ncbi:Peptidoglycan/xylan/chitin deacetylase, PgdA/CDA1 family [Nitrosomonas sp. Nm51]|uniref:polysaccharide deacetylase family protein n=1 Tax=Nitrosomonas sp. Nm51 TaxID=133720 RepID=UPI0008D5698B|nr:polysaccharide deacetylase family protein [Nitrosomonas sp. Nm51]SEQ96428.1 Peptidoglycan/xylan/chitin deacetylase, PgdA/CDA1 family [Nitrosomonas sp. Nm51]